MEKQHISNEDGELGHGVTVIVKTTYRCNMRCAYCYEGDKPQQQKIDFRTVENAIAKFSNHYPPNRRISFIWHGGEPLLMGLDFFQHVVEIQRPYGGQSRFRNSVQTNGLALSPDFIQFFMENGFGIGISLDGPASIHDLHRPQRNGASSFETVVSRLNQIRSSAKDGARFGAALAVLTQHTLEHLDEFYEFFRDSQIDVKINPLLYAGKATEAGAARLRVTPEAYGDALVHLFNRWIEEEYYTFSIENFSSILQSFVRGEPRICLFRKRCHDDYLSIDPEGYVIPCGRWSRTDFVYGNINLDAISDVFNSADYRRYKDGRSRVDGYCEQCRHYDICHGGCAFSGYMRRQNLGDPDFYCVSYMKLFDRMKDVVMEQLARARSGDEDASTQREHSQQTTGGEQHVKTTRQQSD